MKGPTWREHFKRREPQNAAIGRFKPGSDAVFIWCRSRYNEHQKPFVLDARGTKVFDYEMDDVAPKGWTARGVEVIHTIDWTGEPQQLACAKERHRSGDVCLFEPLTGRFVERFSEKAGIRTDFATLELPAKKTDDRDEGETSVKMGATAGAVWAVGRECFAADATDVKARPIEIVRIGLVGIGRRGSLLLSLLLDLEGVEVRAVCDIIPERVAKAQDMATTAKQPRPTGYSRGETDFKRLCETEELDLVINATRPWKWHVPICVAAMTAGKHAATEVPAAETIEECWQLVETAESRQKYCVMLENCCYFREAMLVHSMLRKGLFGELRHCEAGYQHYGVRARRAAPGRARDDKVRTANSYPTHPIGPVAQWMDINRGNRFDYLVSMSADGTQGNRSADINTSLINHPVQRKGTIHETAIDPADVS